MIAKGSEAGPGSHFEIRIPFWCGGDEKNWLKWKSLKFFESLNGP